MATIVEVPGSAKITGMKKRGLGSRGIENTNKTIDQINKGKELDFITFDPDEKNGKQKVDLNKILEQVWGKHDPKNSGSITKAQMNQFLDEVKMKSGESLSEM